MTKKRYESTEVKIGGRWVFAFEATAFANLGGVLVRIIIATASGTDNTQIGQTHIAIHWACEHRCH
jgi:hypothetical protein